MTGTAGLRTVNLGLAVGGVVAVAIALCQSSAAYAYIEAPFPLGRVVNEATNIVIIRVEAVDKEKNTIVYRKVSDIKGTHKGDTIKHNIGRGGFNPREWQTVMAWAEVGQTAVFLYQGGAAETCINGYWYQTYAGGEWWNLSHGEPYLLRTYCGKPERLASYVSAMLAGQEVVIPCMVDGDKNALQLRAARIQRLKASLKINDYNVTRDFVGWGVEEFRPIFDMPGFTHQTALANVGPLARGLAQADFDGDGKIDFAILGGSRLVLLQNGGGSLNEAPLPVGMGANAADWADCNGDARSDLLIATPAGPRLFLNETKGFRDATTGLPTTSTYQHPTAAAWLDFDGDKRPDILLADGFRGLRLYRNKTGETPDPESIKDRFGTWSYAGPFDNANGAGFAKAYPPQTEPFDAKKTWTGKAGQKVQWRPGKFTDGQLNSLALFSAECNESSAVYLYREIHSSQRHELPISLGSDDTLTVWLNGRQLLAANENRPCAPDQNKLTLRLRPGKNILLIKVCNNTGEFAFYFQPLASLAQAPPTDMFEDVSDAAALGENGLGSGGKICQLAVADVNGDGRPDFLAVFDKAPPMLAVNAAGKGFIPVPDSGITCQPGRCVPAFADCDGDGKIDLLLPRAGGGLFRGDGRGRFVNVTAASGALAGLLANATSAAWVSDQAGRPDLVLGCLNGPNRWLRNNGNGTFTDATEAMGLDRRLFNTQAVGLVDINHDGVRDVVFVNEGQESAALLRKPN